MVVVIPLSVTPGLTNKIKIRGQNLTNVSELRFSVTNLQIESAIKSKGKAEVPKEFDAKKIGDTQIELELKLAAAFPTGTNFFTLVSPEGESKPHPLLVTAPGSLLAEVEPNGGFREAQQIQFGQTVQGIIAEPKDVDVFQFHGAARQKISAEVLAARFGSPLDSVLTLYDDRGHILASNDDTETSADSLLRMELPADGIYFLSLIDAHDRGSAAHIYHVLLRVDD